MNQTTKTVAPSLLAADFANLAQAVRLAEDGGAEILHIDVMDGHFVPNLTIGPPVIQAIRRITGLTLDVHLMIEDPQKSLQAYIEAGADLISLHVEADHHLHRAAAIIHEAGKKAGVSLNPATPLSTIEEVLPYVDFVLVMSVNPGFGGQKFILSSLDKIRRLSELIHSKKLGIAIEVDGGVGPDNIAALSAAGVNIAVAGAAVYESSDPAATIRSLRKSML